MMDKRFVSMEYKVEEVFDKINTNKNQVTSDEMSYAEITKKNTAEKTNNIKGILQEQKIEERKIKETECNLIIHGVDESMEETKEELERDDKDFIENMVIKKIELQVDIINVERIGEFSKEREEKERYRSIKILLKNVEMKMKILQNLKKLKGFNIRITEDLTKRERENYSGDGTKKRGK